MNRREVIKRTAWFTGMALSTPMVSGILSGCQAEGDPEWMPELMSQEQAKVAAEMAEAILPKTAGSPGAKEVHVVEFMDKLIKECFEPDDQEKFLKGLDEANQSAQNTHGKALYALSADDRHNLVAGMDEQIKTDMAKMKELSAEERMNMIKEGIIDPNPFFVQFKQLTIAGYFTSEKVGEEVLAYSSVPGEYDGCMDYPNEEVKTAWAL